ncbi:hypothetical protein [Mesorhizobium sp. CAU 1732]|uniref:hypothetical protein n=1 Tax=Mesorhizobium sp. CAU 1732 TaxID=3140358 RepID=UPI00326174B6
MSGDPAEGTGWDPIDAKRDMFRPAPDVLPRWADPAYVKHNIETFQRSGFHGGLNQYRGVQSTFEHLAAFKDVLILRREESSFISQHELLHFQERQILTFLLSISFVPDWNLR